MPDYNTFVRSMRQSIPCALYELEQGCKTQMEFQMYSVVPDSPPQFLIVLGRP